MLKTGSLQKHDSSKSATFEDFVSEADLSVQKLYEQAFKHHFPNLKVNGEESESSLLKVEVDFDPETLNKDFISQEMLQTSFKNRAEFLEK